jgi:hypothetical protein
MGPSLLGSPSPKGTHAQSLVEVLAATAPAVPVGAGASMPERKSNPLAEDIW